MPITHTIRRRAQLRITMMAFLVLLPVFGSANCDLIDQETGVVQSDTLRVATLNLAHGRKDSLNQMFLKDEEIRSNLMEIAGLLRKTEAQVVALQEADAASKWSGKFDHVQELAGEAGFPCIHHGVHASNRIYHFGTALISRYKLEDTHVHNFPPSKPTTTKGFVAGGILWSPGGKPEEAITVKVVSVHLDFSRRRVRKQQTKELAEYLEAWSGPIVVMGDFNTDWEKKDSSLRSLAESLDLKVFKPLADDLATYHKKGSRLDWILLSRDLSFSRYAVFPDIVSDHLLVVADIQLDRLAPAVVPASVAGVIEE